MFIGTDDVHLKPANYQNRANLLPLVDAIVKETEHERDRRRDKKPPLAAVGSRGRSLVQMPGVDYYHTRRRGLIGMPGVDYNHTPWYELLTDLNVIDRCAVALGIDKTALLKRVIEELGPPNWQVFFWMREWFQSVPVANHIAMVSSIAAATEANYRKPRTLQAKRAADSLHNKPGGSREKQGRIRAEWATGKYSDRTRCAEEQCAALDMSYDTARKALVGMPDPDPWPAKKQKKGRKSA